MTLACAIAIAAAATSARGATPAAGAEASTTQPGSLITFDLPAWRAGERGAVTATSTSELVVNDAAGRQVWSGAAAARASTPIPVGEPGYYTLVATAEGRSQAASFAVVPKQRNPLATTGRQVWGVQTHFAQEGRPIERSGRMLLMMNADAVRDELHWGGVEPDPGVFRFQPWHDEYQRMLKVRGIGMFWVAGYNNAKLYGGDRFPAPESGDEMGRYVVAGLERYGDNVIGVEVLNEPNNIDPVERYLPVLKGVHAEVKKAGLKHELVAVGGAGAGGGMSPSYAAKLFENGGAAFCDSFSSHPYMTPFTPDAGYGLNASIDMAGTRGSALAEKYDKGFWITEVGWPGPRPELPEGDAAATQALGTRPMVSAMKQAAFTARTLLGASRYPKLRGLFIYDFQDDGHLPMRREHRFGLVRQDLTPKPGFLAFAVAADFLKDKTFLRRVHKPDGLLSANLYRDGEQNVWAVVWAQEISNAEQLANAREKRQVERPMDRETTARFRVTPADAKVVATDWQGTSVTAAAEMTATNLPTYLNLGKVDAAAATVEPLE